jgi:antitoxin component YwqK of YwqJK toxin-antitoxin module
MKKYNWFFVVAAFSLCSCEQVLRSAAEQTAKASHLKDSLTFEYNEKPIASDKLDTLSFRIEGKDTIMQMRSYFLSGKPYYDGWYKNGILHGTCVYYTEKGNLHYTMECREGKPFTMINSFDLEGNKQDGGSLKNGNGMVKIYHPITGNLFYKATFKDGCREGLAESFYSDGRRQLEITFKRDTTFGNFTEYYHSEQIKEKGNLDMFSVTGNMTSYYPNGGQNQYTVYKNGLEVLYKELDENGHVKKDYRSTDGALMGTNTDYDSEGNLLSKGEMLDRKKHGKYEYFFENGRQKALETYSHDTLLSETIWNDEGKLSIHNEYKNGEKNGICREYYPTGSLRVEQMYVNGVEEGMYKSYFASGNIYNEGQFKNGELTGDLKFYSEQGKLTNTKQYN